VVGGVILKNRLAMAPMTQSQATEGGVATAERANHYRARAGAGLIVSVFHSSPHGPAVPASASNLISQAVARNGCASRVAILVALAWGTSGSRDWLTSKSSSVSGLSSRIRRAVEVPATCADPHQCDHNSGSQSHLLTRALPADERLRAATP
jgi:hypothetical protein